MTFRELAFKNVKGNWHQYSAFFLSCTFSVMIFSMFASFIFNPNVVHGHIRGGNSVKHALLACEYIIIIFSFFFVLYSVSAFVKSRKKEFGLLQLFGMTNHQIRMLVFIENMLIASLSIVAGLILGTLFSKLFNMIISHFLNETSPVPFQLVPEAILITAVGFFVLFAVVTGLQLFSVGKSRIIDLLKASRQPKSQPIFSKWLVGFAIISLLSGYGMAYFSTQKNFGVFMFPVLGLVIVGTYFLFTQGSVAIFIFLQNRTAFYYKGTHLLTLSQMIYKMKDNARVLFLVTILSAVVLTASGTLNIVYNGTLHNVNQVYPNSLSFVVKKSDPKEVAFPAQVEEVFQNNEIPIQERLVVNGFPVKISISALNRNGTTSLLVSESTYNKERQKVSDASPLSLKRGQAVLAYSGPDIFSTIKSGESGSLRFNGKTFSYKLASQGNEGLINLEPGAFGMLVVNDHDYDQLTRGINDSKKWIAYGYNIKNWKETGPIIQKIKRRLPQNDEMTFKSKVENYLIVKQIVSLTLFIGIFVSLLFFIAAGSMIYFKLFTELQEDDAQFKALQRIGMTDEEIKKIVTQQIALIFFVPFAIGAIHALFAFKMLQNIQVFNMMIWGYGGIVIGIFFVMQLLYFFITRAVYLKRLLN